MKERAAKFNQLNCPLPKLNDVVFIYDNNLPRSQLSVVDKFATPQSNSLKIHFANGRRTRRAIDHLLPLETSQE